MLPSYIEWSIKIFAVVGGAAIGAVAIGFLVRRFGKWLTFRDVPGPVVIGFRGLGGIGGGLAVWSMVFAPGGSGLFGGGSVPGGKEAEPGIAKPSAMVPTSIAPATKSANGTSEKNRTLRVVILGGPRVVDERFYSIDGKKVALTLSELKKTIKERQQAGLKSIQVMIYEDSVARIHSAVRDLEAWAQQNDIAISQPPTRGEIPESVSEPGNKGTGR